jgi:hypothetical protein
MLRKIKSSALCLLGLGIFLSPVMLPAQSRQECYVIRADGTRLRGRALSADDKGNLTLEVDDKLKMPFSTGSYRYGFIPKPQEVAALEKLFAEKNYDDVIKNASVVFDKYKYLGWCYVIAALQAESYLTQNKINDARRVISAASRLGGEYRDKLSASIVKLYIADKDFTRADALLKRQLRDADDSTAAQAFCLLGEMAEAQDDKKQAVLEYLKVLMLFEEKKVGETRAIAKSRVLRLMREMKDPRIDKIAAYE